MQTDLVLEAKHLDDFNVNFGGKAWSDCVFPRVIHCVEDVLVRASSLDSPPPWHSCSCHPSLSTSRFSQPQDINLWYLLDLDRT